MSEALDIWVHYNEATKSIKRPSLFRSLSLFLLLFFGYLQYFVTHSISICMYLPCSPSFSLPFSRFLSLSFSSFLYFFLYICHLYVYFLLCIFLARLLTLSIFLSLSFSLFLSLSLCNFLKERTWFWKHVKCIKTRPLYLFLCLNQPFSWSLAGYNRTTNYVLNRLRVDLFSLDVKVDCLDCLLGYCVSLLTKNLMIISNTQS